MSLPLFTIVFLDGTNQYRSKAQAPAVGDIFRHRGDAFVVVTVDSDHNGNMVVKLQLRETGVHEG